MTAKLDFILGRAGAGKTAACVRAMCEAMEAAPLGAPLILLAPEHMTYQAERLLASGMKGRGMMRGFVFGFRRLAWHVAAMVGAGERPRLTELGKRLILKKIVGRRKDSLTALARGAGSRGFAASLAETVKELKSYRGTPEALRAAADEAGEGHLCRKLRDLAMLYEDFLRETAGRFEDAEDRMERLAGAIPRLSEFAEAEVWLDGFIFFNPQERAVIRAFLDTAAAVHITLPLDRDVAPEEPVGASELFYRAARTLQGLKRMAREVGIPFAVNVLGVSRRFDGNAPGLAAVERGLFALPAPRHHGARKGVRVVEAATRRLEIEAAAADIVRLCREEGLRWRDIGILLRDRESYGEILGFTLADYGIPFFSDQKRAGVHHPLAELVRSALGVVTGGWSYDDVFRCVKTDLLPVTRDEADRLENYALAFGIRGESSWRRVWPYFRRRSLDEDVPEARVKSRLAEINEIRARVAAPFFALSDDLRKAADARSLTRAVYRFLMALSVPETLARWAAEAEAAGAPEEAKEHRMIWGAVTELFDQLATVSGDEAMPLSDYAELLGDGLDALEISLIPQGLDSVTVAAFDQNSLNNIRALYILDANEGVMPRRPSSGGILSDADRALLASMREETRLELQGCAAEESCGENYLLYRGFTEARQYLWVSYALADAEGDGLRRSSVVTRLQKLLSLPAETIPLEGMEQSERFLFTTGRRAVSRLAPALREYVRASGETKRTAWAEVYNWALVHEAERLSRIVDGLSARAPKDALAPATAARLFARGKRLAGSVTRFESYYACPFRHFSQYGLRLSRREEHGFRAPDFGILLHELMRRYGEKLKAEGRSWSAVSGEERTAFVRDALRDAAPRVQSEILLSTAQYRSITERIAATAESSLSRLVGLDGGSVFRPRFFELSFGRGKEAGELITRALSDGTKLDITGQIDRVDLGCVGNDAYFLVIDYKTGEAKLSVPEVYYGLRLQLVTYLVAAARFLKQRTGGAVLPAGALYFALKNPVESGDTRLDSVAAEERLLKELRMNGWILSDAEVVKGIDGAARYIRVALKRDGEISGHTPKDSLKTQAEFHALARHTIDALLAAGEAILGGRAEVAPYRLRDKTPCGYCDFREVCGFDEKLGFAYRTLDDTEDLMEKLMGGAKG